MTFNEDDQVRNKSSYARMGHKAPVWCVTKPLPDGTFWAWSNGRGERLIKRPENYEKLPGRIPVAAETLLAGAGG